ncbi:MAG: hypothetical protein ACI8RD_003943 [Bacillariaceae sp.]|jgi:hypothetical protein
MEKETLLCEIQIADACVLLLCILVETWQRYQLHYFRCLCQ